ncbi:predicted protein [Aspergillus terreus NIH2624]|uniref:Peptidase A1 domain-containing protein n=1 Tax=Aspergillus terreus (strain NIH 2624 / FGSC A1156) TaxID=341663 RepID=Q0CE59_ASPTN|nr:uncharacterized protein ATEG_08025 [Aspergillus terreus NIH2624]EAU31198.1 predicted protein [Aspergillus terreus NIH2624]
MRTRSLFLLSILGDAAHAVKPLAMNWSSQAYGPDGPWQAVRIDVGSNNQPIDLYPGANYATTILADSICANTTLSTTCYAARAGTYNESESKTALVTNRSSWETTYWSVEGGSIQGRVGDQVNIGPVVPNISFTTIYETYQTYPNGKQYPVPVGTLALGAPYLKDTGSGLTLNMIAGWLYASGVDNAIPSYSYAMHIGSVDPAIPGSLVLGGYDKSRALGEVSAQPVDSNVYASGAWQIELKDIGLGVATGGSPFAFTSKNGLFLQDSGAVVPKTATIDPTKPYMYLPKATCDAITSVFSISFDSELGLYIWDTTASNYANITTSATYLAFTFNKNALTDQTITIKVPLRLLTLTLQDPLVDQNATYFPCFHSTDSPVIGRAFLQAAFVGVNWFEGNGTGTWFLGQAPGPDLADADITAVNVQDRSLAASNQSWEQSWAKHWTVLPASSANSTSADGGGLSTGAKVGIGVGVGVGGAILIVAAVWIVLRRRRRRPDAENETPVEERRPVHRGLAELPPRPEDEAAKELSTTKDDPKELTTKDKVHPQEIMSSQEPPRHELE